MQIDPAMLASLGVGGVLALIMLYINREQSTQHKEDMQRAADAGAKREDRMLDVLQSNAATNAALVPALTALVNAVADLASRLPPEWDGSERRAAPRRASSGNGGIRDGADAPK